jgi:phage/plasmid primase, P4 family, C-terminal domain
MTTAAESPEVEEALALLLAAPRRVAAEATAAGGGSGGDGDGGHVASERPAEGPRPQFLIASPNAPMPVALDLLERWPFVRYAGSLGVRRTIHWHGEWWDHVGSYYRLSNDKSLENSLWRVLNAATYERPADDEEEGPQIRRWEPNKTKVSNVVKALEARCEVGEEVEAGSWLVFPTEEWLTPYQDDSRSDRLVSFMNVMLNLDTRETCEHSDAYLNTYALPFEYDATAECGAWEAYLASILSADSVKLLQEWFGYVVSGRTDLQKMLYMLGPSRSGKGTIALILSRLIGMMNVAGPTLNSFAGQFGLQPLIGKPLAIFDDVRLPPRPDTVYTALEKLLSVIGEGSMTVDRKNKESVTAKLPTRIMMSANELLQFPDEVGAMQTRMLVLVFTQSFVGREKRDEEFKNLFLAELPGILNWALAGLRRLDEQSGRFTLPADSTEVSEELRDAGNHVRPFIRDHCEIGGTDEHWVWVDEIYGLYAETRGGFKDDAAQKDRFGRELKAAFPSVKKKRKRKEGVLTYYYTGVTLLPEYRARAEAQAAELESMREAARWARGLRG